MALQDTRDIVIIITGILWIILLLGFGIGGFILYKKISRLTDSVKKTVSTAQAVVTSVADALRPIIVLAALVRRFRRRKQHEARAEKGKAK